MIRNGSVYTQLSTLLLLAADGTSTLAWQRLLNLSALSAGLTGLKKKKKKVHTLTLFIAASGQLTTVVLSFTA